MPSETSAKVQAVAIRPTPRRVVGSFVCLLALGLIASGCGNAAKDSAQLSIQAHSAPLPAPSKADGRLLETVLSDSIGDCLKINLALIPNASHANERITQAQEARELLSTQIGEVIALYKRVNPDVNIPYGEGRHITTRQDISSIIKELRSRPTALSGAPACDAELAQRLSQETTGE